MCAVTGLKVCSESASLLLSCYALAYAANMAATLRDFRTGSYLSTSFSLCCNALLWGKRGRHCFGFSRGILFVDVLIGWNYSFDWQPGTFYWNSVTWVKWSSDANTTTNLMESSDAVGVTLAQAVRHFHLRLRGPLLSLAMGEES